MNHFGMYFHLWHHSKITKILSTAILLLFTWAWEVYPVMAAFQEKKEFEQIQVQQRLEQAIQFFRTIQTLQEQLQPNKHSGKQPHFSNPLFSPAMKTLRQIVSQPAPSSEIHDPLAQLPDFVRNVISEDGISSESDEEETLSEEPANTEHSIPSEEETDTISYNDLEHTSFLSQQQYPLLAQADIEFDIVNDASPLNLPSTGDRDYILLAQVPQYYLMISKTGSGTITGQGINCGTICRNQYANGEIVTLTATPNIGWRFSGWSGQCVGNGTCAIAMNAHATVRATFTFMGVPNSYMITATAGNNGNITPQGTKYVTCGTSQPINIAAEQGYQIKDVVVDGTSIGVVSSYTFKSDCNGQPCDPTKAKNLSLCDNNRTCMSFTCTNGICINAGNGVTFGFSCMTGGTSVNGATISCLNGSCVYENADGSGGSFSCGCIQGLGETHTIQANFVKQTNSLPSPYSAEQRATFQRLGVQQTTMPCDGDPVNTATGNHVQQLPLLSVPGLGNLAFELTLTYNSQDAREGLFGYGWSSFLDTGLRLANDGSIDVRYADGRSAYFLPQGDQYVAGYLRNTDRLIHTDSGFELITLTDLAYQFNHQGLMTGIRDRKQHVITFERDASGRLTGIRDTVGRAFRIVGDGTHLTSLTDPAGRTLKFTYENGNLSVITDANSGIRRFEYQNHLLTKTIDPEGILYLQNTYNSNGQVVEQIDAAGQQSHFDYSVPQQTIYTTPLGHATRYVHDERFRVVKIQDALGLIESRTFDEADHLVASTDKNGNRWTYTYDQRGNMTNITTPDGGSIKFSYDAANQLLSMADASDGVTSYAYENGNVTQITQPDGTVLRLTYNALGLPLTVTDALGRTTRLMYDSQGNLTASTNPAGAITRYQYDQIGRMIGMTDANGHALQLAYSGSDNILSITSPNGTRVTFEYDRNNNLTKMTDRLGSVTTFEYDANFHLITETDPSGNTVKHQYDADSLRILSVDRRGNRTQYRYDAIGRLVEVENALGDITRLTYTPNGEIASVRDPLGHESFFAYDSLGRLIRQTDALGQAFVMTYDKRGQILSVTQPNQASIRYEYDAMGRLTTMFDPQGGKWGVKYDAAGNVTEISDAAGYAMTLRYDAGGNIVETLDAAGASTRYEYDSVGNRLAMIDALGRISRFAYDEHDRLVKMTDSLGYIRAFEYDANDRLIAMTDANGAVTRVTYNAVGLPAELIDAAGHATRWEYDKSYNLTRFTDPKGAVWNFTYDPLNRLTDQTDPLGKTTHAAYNAVGDVTRVTDAMGFVTQYEYDALSRLTKEIDAAGRIWQIGYDAVGNIAQVVDPRGATTKLTYNASGQLTGVQDALGGKASLAYDAVGNLTGVTDPNRNSVALRYDPLRRLSGVTDAVGNSTSLTYDKVGNMTALTDALGRITRVTYNAANQPEAITDALGGLTRFAYDGEGNLTTRTDANGHTSKYAYNALGLLISQTEPGGETTRYEYNAANRLIKKTNASSHSWTYTYDALDRLTSEADPLGNTTTYAYDNLDRLTQIIDANGLGRHYVYDSVGRLTAVRLPDQSVTNYAYDAADNLTSITDANGHATSFTYDLKNRLLEEVDPSGNTWRYEYDAADRLIKKIANSSVTGYAYDANDRLTGVRYPDGSAAAFEYDPVGNQTRMTDRLGETRSEYDALNRLIATTDAAGHQVKYAYDAIGNLTALTYPDQETIAYQYDANDLMTQAKVGSQKVFDITRDAAHNVVNVLHPNGATVEYRYDAAERLIGVHNRHGGQTVSAFDYTLDAVGNRLKSEETYAWRAQQTLTHTYTYDRQYRLIRSEDNEGNFTDYAFDAVGNRIGMTSNMTSATDERTRTEYAYGADNRLTGVKNFVADAQGNWKTQDETEIRYDGYGRSAQRLYKRDGKQTQIDYVYAGLDPIAEYVNGDSKHLNYYRDQDNTLLGMSAVDSAGQRASYDYQHDGLGSLSAVTNEQGQLVHAYRYGDYGEMLDRYNLPADQQGVTAPHSAYAFTGQEWDQPNNLHHFYSRDYDPSAGVWLQQDAYRGQLSDPQTLHRYGYVKANPVSFVDLYGYGIFSDIGDFFGDVFEEIGDIVKDIGKAISSAVSSVVKAVSSVVEGVWNTVKSIATNFKAILSMGISGLLTLGIPALLALIPGVGPIVAAVAGGALAGGLSSIASGLIMNGSVNWKDVLIGAATGGISAGVTAGTGTILSNLSICNPILSNLTEIALKSAGSGLAGGLNQTVRDLVYTGNVNWGNTLSAGLMGFGKTAVGQGVNWVADTLQSKLIVTGATQRCSLQNPITNFAKNSAVTALEAAGQLGQGNTLNAIRVIWGYPFSILSGDIFDPVAIIDPNADGANILGIFTPPSETDNTQQAIRYGYNNLNLNPIYNGTHGIGDFIQIIGEELRGITISSIYAAKALELTNGGYVIAHSQGTSVIRGALPLLSDEIKSNIIYQGFGGQTIINSWHKIPNPVNVINPGDIVYRFSIFNLIQPPGTIIRILPQSDCSGLSDCHNFMKYYYPNIKL